MLPHLALAARAVLPKENGENGVREGFMLPHLALAARAVLPKEDRNLRRGWDSNPRNRSRGSQHFECCALGRTMRPLLAAMVIRYDFAVC